MQFSCTCTLFTCTSSFDVFFIYKIKMQIPGSFLSISLFHLDPSIYLKIAHILTQYRHVQIKTGMSTYVSSPYIIVISQLQKCVLTKPLLLFFFLNFDKNIIIGFLLMKMHSLIFIFFFQPLLCFFFLFFLFGFVFLLLYKFIY